MVYVGMMQGVIDNLTAETDALQERLATKTMKKRDYKKSLHQLTAEHDEVKRAYMQHDQDRERERERMHEVENQLAEKTQECLEKEMIGYALNTGLAALTPVQWRSEAVIQYLRGVVNAGREEIETLRGIIAERDALIETKRREILKLNRVVRNNETDIETLRERVSEISQELEETKVAENTSALSRSPFRTILYMKVLKSIYIIATIIAFLFHCVDDIDGSAYAM
jgi:chromosome segregation ATPase